MASNCRVELPSPPQRRRARPKAKVSTSNSQHDGSPNGEGSLASRPSWQRSHLSVSLTQETSKLRKDLSKIIVLDVISGQTTDDILLEFLLGALNTPRVDAVYEFRGNSFLATLNSEEEALKASKIGDLSLPSEMGPCVFSISPWSADIRSVRFGVRSGPCLDVVGAGGHITTYRRVGGDT